MVCSADAAVSSDYFPLLQHLLFSLKLITASFFPWLCYLCTFHYLNPQLFASCLNLLSRYSGPSGRKSIKFAFQKESLREQAKCFCRKCFMLRPTIAL